MDDLKLFWQNEKQIDTLAKTVRIFSEDIGMEYRQNNIYNGIKSEGEGIQLPHEDFIKNIDKGGGHKYLAILEDDGFKNL